jgi:hypothetical protein
MNPSFFQRTIHWAAVALLFCHVLQADQFGDFTYTDNGADITMTGYTGAGGAVEIPASINSKPVVEIGAMAFYRMSSITSISIPDSVTRIGQNAFHGCSELDSIQVETSNSQYSSTNGVLFNKAKTILLECPEGKSGAYTIPSTVTNIETGSFSWCTAITSITIPPNVANIGEYVFNGCGALTAIEVAESNPNYSSANGVLFNKTQRILKAVPASKRGSYIIPTTVTNIANNAFFECSAITNITMPDSVTSIGYQAFYNCSSLLTLNLSDSLQSIGYSAFWGCSSLTGELTIPDGVQTIEWYTFRNCSKLTNVIIKNSVTSIGYQAFYYCTSLTNFSIPESVTSIEDKVFFGCESLKSITIPNSITRIGEYSLYGCTALENVIIPDSVVNIGNQAFFDCSALREAYFQGNAPLMGNSVFYNTGPGFKVIFNPETNGFSSPWWNGYPSEEKGGSTPAPIFIYTDNGEDITINRYIGGGGAVVIPGTIDGKPVRTIDDVAFSDNRWVTEISIPESIPVIPVGAFAGCIALTNITIPNTVISIEDSAFSGCVSLKSVTIPIHINRIPAGLFNGCSQLESVILPDAVTSIGWNAFAGCTSLKSIIIPPNVNSIADQVFTSCESLMRLTIPRSVTSIGPECFSHCTSLTEFDVDPLNPAYSSFEGVLFKDDLSYSEGVLYNRVRAVLMAYPGGKTGTYTIPNSVRLIDHVAFSGCEGLISLHISNGVSEIGDIVFVGCKNLISINVDDSNPYFSSDSGVLFDKSKGTLIAFPGGLSGKYSIPSTVHTLRSSAFESCRRLTEVIIPNSVTFISGSAFFGCSDLQDVQIPNSITSIYNGAFFGCSKIKKVTIPASVTSIGIFAFAGCSALETAHFQGNAPFMGPHVFGYPASGFKVLYQAGATGFTTPTWNGYPCEQFVPNAAPVLRSIGNKSIAAGRNLSFTVTADDADGEPLTYSAAAAQP